MGKVVREQGEIARIKGTFQDITESAELERERDRLLEGALDLIAILEDADDRFLYVNPAFSQRMGWEKSELLFSSFIEYVHPDDRSRIDHRLRDPSLNDRRLIEGRFATPKGNFRWIQWRFTPDRENNRWYAIGRDITVQREAEELLKESEERYRTIFRDSPVPMLLHHDRRIIDVNSAFLDLLNESDPEQILGTDPITLVHPDHVERVKERMAGILEGEDVPVEEVQFILPGGGVIDVEVQERKIALRGTDRIQLVAKDISERKRAEEELRKLSLVARKTDNGVVITDKDLRIEWVNEGFERMTGYAFEQIQEGNVTPYLFRGDEDEKRDRLERLSQGESYTTELEFDNQEGEQRCAYVSVTPVMNGDRHPDKFVIIASDVTEKRLMEEQIMDAVVNAQENERRRFAQDLHDGLGQILTATKMYVDTLGNGVSEDLKEVHKNASQLITQAIQEARSVSHSLMPKELEENSLTDSIDQVCRNLKNSGELVVDLEHDVDEELIGDKVRYTLFRILQEALNNVSKHARAERVEVNLFTDRERNSVHLVVLDDGQGFDRDALQENGIGLENLEKRAEFLGGKAMIDSQVGKGTRLQIDLPAGPRALS